MFMFLLKLDHLIRCALHEASLNGYTDIAALLIRNGAQVDAVDSSGRLVLRSVSFVREREREREKE